MVRSVVALARRLLPGVLVLATVPAVSTCRLDKILKPPTGGILQVSPPQLTAAAAVGSRAGRVMTVEITNGADGDLAWTASRMGTGPWLALRATGGTAPSTLEAIADPTGLAVAQYEDTLVVAATGAAGGTARIPIRFTVHPCTVQPISPSVDVFGRLDATDCTAPHRDTTFADLFSFTGSAGDSVSVALEADEFTPHLILDTASVPTGTAPAYVEGKSLRYLRLPASGTYVIAATTEAPGDSGSYVLSVSRPRLA